MWVGEALSFGKLILPGDRLGCGTVGEWETSGKLIGSDEMISSLKVEGFVGVGGNRRPPPGLR